MFFVVVEWSAYQVLVFLAGVMDVKTQAGMIILIQFSAGITPLPFGISMAALTIIGNKIGEGDVVGAKFYSKHLNCFGLAWWIFEILMLYFFFDSIWGTFTQDASMNKIRDEVFVYAMLGLCIDFPQVSLGGPLKGLGLQEISSKLYFINYYIIMIPVSILFSFYVGEHYNYDDAK